MNWNAIIFGITVWALPILMAVTMHEAAHGWVAWKLGDETAHRMGRVTFNPFRHIDFFGTVLMPGMLLLLSGGKMMFGFAKPVPVNFMRLRRPRRDMVLVAAAGPATNLVLALVSALLFHALPVLSPDFGEWMGINLFNSVWINTLLAVFNMIPLPPLDGGRVAVGMLPEKLARPLARLERAGFFIIIAAIFLVPWIGDKVGLNLNVFGWLVGEPAEFLARGIFAIAGVD